MKWSILAAAMAVTIAPLTYQARLAAAHDGHGAKRDITIRGCVIPAEKKDTFVMTQVSEVPAAGDHAMPEMAHGRRVVYWLKNLKGIDKHAGHMIEVSGKLAEFKHSEIEVKAGPQKNGELYVEFEGPGRDVKVPNSTVGSTIGTAGRVEPNKNDIKTMLAVVNVQHVTSLSDSCQ